MPLGIITKNTPQWLTWPLTFPKVAQIWNSAPWISQESLIHIRRNQHPGSLPLGIIEEKTVSHLSYVWILQTVFLAVFFGQGEKSPKSCVQKLKIRSCQTLYSLRLFGQSGSFGGTTFLQVAGVWIFHMSFGVPRRAERRGYISISYKMLTLFVRFMLWDSRKWKEIRKQSYSSWMRTKTDTNRKTHPNSETIAKSNTEGTEEYLIRC